MNSEKKIFFISLEDDDIQDFASRIKIKTTRVILLTLRQYGELSLNEMARQITNEKRPRLSNFQFAIDVLVKLGLVKKEYKLKHDHYPINLNYYSLISDIFVILPHRDSKIEKEIQKIFYNKFDDY